MKRNNRLYTSPATIVVPVAGGYLMNMPGSDGGPGIGSAPVRDPWED